jgi:hypothetical protein
MSRVATAWKSLSHDLPAFHAPLSAGDAAAFIAELQAAQPVELTYLRGLDPDIALLLGLDVLMVEATARRHEIPLDGAAGEALRTSIEAVSSHLDVRPIITYPLYIRHNPIAIDQIRRFTPLASEFRFIRMHRLIEDIFDQVIPEIDRILDSDAPGSMLIERMPLLREDFLRVCRSMSGFRSEARMPHAEFFDEFRPYYSSVMDPESGEVQLHGPSGLQSGTYRMLAMQVGYGDPHFDGVTRRTYEYQMPALRASLRSTMERRESGKNLRSLCCDAILGDSPKLPGIHPVYGEHSSRLAAFARSLGFLSPELDAVLEREGLRPDSWPSGAQVLPLPELEPFDGTRLSAEERSVLSSLIELEALLFSLNLEHVATAAVQIGTERGTAGTSGVEFLMLGTFRRAFPRLWMLGLDEMIG